MGSGLGAIHGGVRKASDVTDDNFHQTIVPQRRVADARGDGKPTKEALMTGNCMTCANLAQFSKGQESFKCRICKSVTYFARPPPSEGEFRQYRLGSQGAGSPPKQSSSWGSGRAPPISVEHTRRVVRQCISTFIARRLRIPGDARHPPSPGIGATDDPLRLSHRVLNSTNPFLRPRQASSSAQGGSTPSNIFDEEPTLRPPPLRSNTNPSSRSVSASHPEQPPQRPGPPQHRRNNSVSVEEEWTRIFKPLEDYIVKCFASFDCVNSSFMTQGKRPSVGDRSHIEPSLKRKQVPPPKREPTTPDSVICDLDPKLLLMGTIAENGLLWMGGQPETPTPTRRPSWKDDTSAPPVIRPNQINWDEVAEWYSILINCAETWDKVYEDVMRNENVPTPLDAVLEDIELQLLRAQDHMQKTLIKATETILKEPGRPMTNPDDLRFLLIILENPLLCRTFKSYQGRLQRRPFIPDRKADVEDEAGVRSQAGTGGYTIILKRIFGLMTNSSHECQSNIVAWFIKYPLQRFTRVKDLAAGFLTYRLVRQSEKKPEVAKVDVTAGLIPSMSTGRSAASLHAALGNPNTPKKNNDQPNKIVYNEDWQISATVRFLNLLFTANNSDNIRRGDRQMMPWANEGSRTGSACTRRQLLPTSDFYNTLLDLSDLVAEFQKWESRRYKFSFCQYPFLLSIWAKTQILEFDAKRQMTNRARDAFFEGIMSRRNVHQYLHLDVRRDCLVEDSLKAVSEVIGSGGEDIKKALRISFRGEEGVDAGGLRKEWFLSLIREVFDPHHGMCSILQPTPLIAALANALKACLYMTRIRNIATLIRILSSCQTSFSWLASSSASPSTIPPFWTSRCLHLLSAGFSPRHLRQQPGPRAISEPA
jgi:E3 ubiquitin-protein ligase HECTD2